MKNYFVTGNTTSVTIANPTWTGYDFKGWSYIDKNGAEQTITTGTSSTTVDINGGSCSNANTASVNYGSTLTQPTDPARDNYAFDGWTVKSSTRAIKASQAVTLTAGSRFDFAATKLTADITLQAAWKHVHSYVRVPMSRVNSVIPDVLTQEEIESYSPYMHCVMCSLVDDYYFEAHTYNKNSKCVCGAAKPSSTVTLEKTYGDSSMIVTSTPAQNSAVTLVAPPKGTDHFVKWEYRSLNGSTWSDFAAAPVVGFVLPGSMHVNAVYGKLTAPKLTLKTEHYGDDGLLWVRYSW